MNDHLSSPHHFAHYCPSPAIRTTGPTQQTATDSLSPGAPDLRRTARLLFLGSNHTRIQPHGLINISRSIDSTLPSSSLLLRSLFSHPFLASFSSHSYATFIAGSTGTSFLLTAGLQAHRNQVRHGTGTGTSTGKGKGTGTRARARGTRELLSRRIQNRSRGHI